MTSAALTWPPALQDAPAVKIVERSIVRGRLSHSLLISGDDYETLLAVTHVIADHLLNPVSSPTAQRCDPEKHPDCFALRPVGRSRQIRAGTSGEDPGSMREFIRKIGVSASNGNHKVGIVHEAESMNLITANVFLKTLEEPPDDTTLLVVTTRPYMLLPTIRSRCLNFRFPLEKMGFLPDGWDIWLDDYRNWLERLAAGITDKRAISDVIFTIYGLTARYGEILEAAVSKIWDERKKQLPDSMEKDQRAAMEIGLAHGLCRQLFAEIERATRDFAFDQFSTGDESFRRAFTRAVDKLEECGRLLQLNLKPQAALESFLLASLRCWAARQ